MHVYADVNTSPPLSSSWIEVPRQAGGVWLCHGAAMQTYLHWHCMMHTLLFLYTSAPHRDGDP